MNTNHSAKLQCADVRVMQEDFLPDTFSLIKRHRNAKSGDEWIKLKKKIDQLVGSNHEHTLNCVRFLTNERISSQSLLERYIASASLSQETQAFGRAFLKCHEGSVALWAIRYICECSVITLDKDFNGNTTARLTNKIYNKKQQTHTNTINGNFRIIKWRYCNI